MYSTARLPSFLVCGTFYRLRVIRRIFHVPVRGVSSCSTSLLAESPWMRLGAFSVHNLQSLGLQETTVGIVEVGA